jgi:hypothetical protein
MLSMLTLLALLATLAGGCVSDYGPTSPDYYPQFPRMSSKRDGQEKEAGRRSLPAGDAIVQASSMRRGEKAFAGALKGGTDI